MIEKNVTESRYTLGALLRKPYDALVKEVYGEIAKSHPTIRPSHGRVLRHILPNGSRVVDLANFAGMTKQSMATLVTDLESHGYVTSVPDLSDARAKRVQLTLLGTQVQEQIIEMSAAFEARWANIVGEEHWARTRGVLVSLFDKLDSN